jgi:hypothetical protein
MSASPPKADIGIKLRNVSFDPQEQIKASMEFRVLASFSKETATSSSNMSASLAVRG